MEKLTLSCEQHLLHLVRDWDVGDECQMLVIAVALEALLGTIELDSRSALLLSNGARGNRPPGEKSEGVRLLGYTKEDCAVHGRIEEIF